MTRDLGTTNGAWTNTSVQVHGRKYNLPQRPTVVVCVDGFDPEYLQAGIADGITPNLARFVQEGFSTVAQCAMPSFTNPNNVSIVTGAPTAVHGISGNFYLDKKTKEEIMIVDDSQLRGTTILEQLSKSRVRVAAVTAKDKLRKLIGHGLDIQGGALCFSAEKANTCTLSEHGLSDVERWIGRPTPSQYSGDLSLFVMDAGIKVLEEDRADFLYLTLSDFVQHHSAPQSEASNDFYRALDSRLGRLAELGAVIAITGDHGMSDKADEHGNPNILFLQDALEEKWGQSCARVICPITDPFVKHHGALGSFVRVHLADDQIAKQVTAFCQAMPAVELAMERKAAAELFDMPADREADVVVVAKKSFVIGSCAKDHDLSTIAGHRLRSHGGLSEQNIPLILSVPSKEAPGSRVSWRNFDAFHLALNTVSV
ncbi:phosphonoacetate hydrolase [Exophiala mesophila]|uniref:Phosphonoacetate hydrolase n=1 Tax=Exophiala mesophila TaxID=212818 RepID=A0A0D1XJL8_EXOME|nr:phosphonoacetate hydrolase [Exophiala mesophila]KIV88396.1 phosphonoacetate hydrolase [Exophiala mesophila]